MTTTSEKPALRAAVYLRQSQDRNGDELAISRQRADCLAVCKAKGWEPTEYPDNDRSASNGKLGEHYQRMLADIRGRAHRRGGGLGPRPTASPPDRAGGVHQPGRPAQAGAGHGDRRVRPVHRQWAAVRQDQGRGRSRRSRTQVRAAEARRQSSAQTRAPSGGRRVRSGSATPTASRCSTTTAGRRWTPSRPPRSAEAYSAVLAGSSCYAIVADWNARVCSPRAGTAGVAARYGSCSSRRATPGCGPSAADRRPR